MTPVKVVARFDLLFRGSGTEYDSLEVALNLALLLMAVAAVIALVFWITGIGKSAGKRGTAG
jgi:hypothetical protein